MRTLLSLVLGLTVTLVAAAVVLPDRLDWNAHRPTLAAYLAQRLGHPVALEGDLGIELLPSPVLHLRQVRIGAGPERTADGGLGPLTIETLDLTLDWTSLVIGPLRIRHALATGMDVPLAPPAHLDPATLVEGLSRMALPDISSGGTALRLDQLTVRDGRIALGPRDPGAASGGSIVLAVPTARFTAESADGAAALQARLNVADRPLTLALTLPPADAGGASEAVNLTLSAPDQSAALRLSGRREEPGGGRRAGVAGAVTVTAERLDALMPWVDRLGGGVPAEAARLMRDRTLPVRLAGAWSLSDRALRLDLTAIELGASRAAGRFTLEAAGRGADAQPALTARLAWQRFALEDWLDASHGEALDRLVDWLTPPAFGALSWPAGMARLGLSIADLTDRSGSLGSLILAAQADPSALRLDRLEAAGPGGVRLSATGVLERNTTDEGPARRLTLQGQVSGAQPGAASLRVSGQVGDATRLHDLDLTVTADLTHPDAVFAALGRPSPAVLATGDRVRVTGTVHRGQGPARVEGRLDLGAGRIALGGLVHVPTDAGRPVGDLHLRVYHPRLGGVLAWLDPELRFAGEADPGALDLYAELRGTTEDFVLEKLAGTVGGVALTGTLTVARSPAPDLEANGRRDRAKDGAKDGGEPSRLRIDLDAALGRLALERFRLAHEGTAGSAPAFGAAWSQARAWLGAVAGKVSLSAVDLLVAHRRLRNVTLAATLTPGRLEVSELRARVADGTLTASGSLEDGKPPDQPPAWTVRLRLADALLDGPVLTWLLPLPADPDRPDFLRGAVALAADVQGLLAPSGAARLDSLTGTAVVSIERGMLRGLDLDAAAAVLAEDGARAALRAALSAGSTIFRRFEAAFRLHDGLAETDALTLEADSGHLTGSARIDLEAGTLALETGLVLAPAGPDTVLGLTLQAGPDGLQRALDLAALAPTEHP